MLPVGALCFYQAHFGRTVLPKWPLWAHLFYSVFYSVSEFGRACFRQARVAWAMLLPGALFRAGAFAFPPRAPKSHFPLPHLGPSDHRGKHRSGGAQLSARTKRVSTEGVSMIRVISENSLRNYCIKCPRVREIWPFHGYPFCGYPFWSCSKLLHITPRSNKRCFSEWCVQRTVMIRKGRRHQNAWKHWCFQACGCLLKVFSSVASRGEAPEKHRSEPSGYTLKKIKSCKETGHGEKNCNCNRNIRSFQGKTAPVITLQYLIPPRISCFKISCNNYRK